MHHPTDRIAHTTAFVTPVVEHWLERETAQWVHPMKDRSDDPSHHERTLLPRSYISLPVRNLNVYGHVNKVSHSQTLKDVINELLCHVFVVAVFLVLFVFMCVIFFTSF